MAGRLFGKLRRHHASARQFEGAVAAAPGYPAAHCFLGWSFAELRQHERAISAFDQALHISPDNPYARAHRGLSLMYLGKYQEAAADLNRSFRIQPKYQNKPRYLEALAQCYCHLDQFESALETYLAAGRLAPNNFEFVFRVGWALSKLERYEEAEAHLRRAVSL